MASQFLQQRLRIARIAGIDLFVHWTFAIVVAYVAYYSRGGGWESISFSLLVLLGMFTCVTLHEYGHALAARRYGIPTADITLLPIGGLARLGQMPRIPMQELVVALAGPAVNVVIVGMLVSIMAVITRGDIFSVLPVVAGISDAETLVGEDSSLALLDRLNSTSAQSYLLVMMFVNTALVLFNLIPAFPMDGGRVLRSILAMLMDYRRATFLASRLGLVLAVMMGLTALSSDPPNWVPVGIAVFIAFAGISEARQVEMVESVRGIRAGDVVIPVAHPLSIDDTISIIASRWHGEPSPVLPVVSGDRIVVGTISLKDVTLAIERGVPENTTAGQLINHASNDFILGHQERLEDALLGHGNGPRWLAVADDHQRLVGMLHLDTFLMRRLIGRANESPIPSVTPPDSTPIIDVSG